MTRKASSATQARRNAMAERHPRFIAALRSLAPTRDQRVSALDVDEMTFDRLLMRLPFSLEIYRAHPHILRALADDFENCPEK